MATNMSLVFNGLTLRVLSDGKQIGSFAAISGRTAFADPNREVFEDNLPAGYEWNFGQQHPDFAPVPNNGPLPEGLYTIEPGTTRNENGQMVGGLFDPSEGKDRPYLDNDGDGFGDSGDWGAGRYRIYDSLGAKNFRTQ